MSGETVAGACESDQVLLPIPCAPITAQVDSSGLAQVREYIRASKAESTLRGYQSDWRNFCAWCEAHGGLCPLPAATEV